MMQHKNRDIIDISINALKNNTKLKKTIKCLALCTLIYYQPSYLIIPICEGIIKLLQT